VFEYGFNGVDIFFVLSGFVIFYSNGHKIGDKSKVVNFFLQRMVRIFPSYWMFLFIPLVIVFFINPGYLPNPDSFNNYEWINSFFLLFNHTQMTQITWTLSFELYFYIIFSLIIFHRKFVYLGVLTVIVAFFNQLKLVNINNDLLGKYYFSPLILEFFFGVITAVLIVKKIQFSKKLALAIILVGLISFVLFSFDFGIPYYLIRSHRSLIFGIPAFLIILGLTQLEANSQIFKIPNYLIKLGDASYILYIIHSPIISIGHMFLFSFNLTSFQNLFCSCTLVLAICIVSVVLHEKLEWPLYKYLKNKIQTL
jgi:peptidoglycan/LPS O-acetylase OafA/YrhL